MKKKTGRIVSFAAAAALILHLTSCVSINLPDKRTGSQGASSSAEPAESYETPEYDYDVVKNDFQKEINRYAAHAGSTDLGGGTVMIATPKEGFFDDDQAGVSMSEASFMRNRAVEKAFNVTIITKTEATDLMYENLSAACLAGDFYADLILIPEYYVHQFAVSGLLMNMNSLPFSDYESGFNIKSGADAAMAMSTGYALGGWATLEPDGLPAVFFNKDIMKDITDKAGLEDPYELARRGEWTWDAFLAYCAAASALNDDAGTSYRTYGAGSVSAELADIVFISEGNRFISSGLSNYPTVAYDAASSAGFAATSDSLRADPLRVADPAEAVSLFQSGSSLFLIDRLGAMKTLSNSEAVWGILPVPKDSAERESYSSLVPADALMFAVPANTTGAEKSSRIMTALNIHSIGRMVDAYITDSMYYYVRDNDSLDSIEKICYSAVYDMAYATGGYDDSIGNATYLAARDVFANGGDLASYLDTYSFSAEASLTRLFS